MKLQIMSDVHLEHHLDMGQTYWSNFQALAPVCILAGDIDSWRNIEITLRNFCDKFEHIVYVPGNHEYYGSSFAHVDNKLSKLNDSIKNLHILNNDGIVIDGQRFVGTTLWFELTPQAIIKKYVLNDFRFIKNFRNEIQERNENARNFLYDANITSNDVVITHHVPNMSLIHSIYQGSSINCFFYCDMKYIFEKSRPKLWCYGHTHIPSDRVLGDTRCVCNPIGYPHEANEDVVCVVGV